MSDENSEEVSQEQAEARFRKWVEGQFENMGRYAADNKLLEGSTAEGRPTWAIPGKLFIGRIWDKEDETNVWWIISGSIPTDHIEGSVAATPREALRHFCLKWQLQSGRLEQAADPTDKQSWTGIGDNLASQAEALYPLVDEDRLWENTS